MNTNKQRSRGRRRCWRSVIVWVALLCFLGFSTPPVLILNHPAVVTDIAQIDKLDYLYVLGPAYEDRVAYAQKLMDKGVADHLLISTSPKGAKYAAATIPLCNYAVSYEVTCNTPHPFTTAGEAAYLSTLGITTDEVSVGIVTSPFHSNRAQAYFAICSAHVTVLPVDLPADEIGGTVEFGYQHLAWLRMLAPPYGCRR